METLSRKKRRKPDPFGSRRTHVTPEGVKILKLLGEYPYLTPHLIARANSKNTVYRTRNLIRDLVSAGYIRYYNTTDGTRLSIFTRDVFTIDELGVDFLVDQEGVHPDAIHYIHRRKDKQAFPNFLHDFAVSNALATMQTDLIGTPYEFAPWSHILERSGYTATTLLPCTLQYSFPDGHTETVRNTFIRPDAIFAIRYPNDKASFYALEIERGNGIFPTKNLSQASLLKKIVSYRDIQRTQVYKEKLGIDNLRTLVITKSSARALHMAEKTAAAFGPTNQFMFTHAPMHLLENYDNLVFRDWHVPGNPSRPLVVE